MVNVLAIDVGSSSVKAAVLSGTDPVSPLAREPFPTRYDGTHAEVDPAAVLKAVARAARSAVAGNTGKPVDLVALSTMSPAWLAMDKSGQPLTPIITHQDRRSLAEAHLIETAIGKARHLATTGNRPVPGGISSTTALHFTRHHKALMRKAALVGHLQTFLLHRLTAARAIDPSNASFTGLYSTQISSASDPLTPLGNWDEDLVAAAGLKLGQLPNVLPGDTVAGLLTPEGARLLGLPRGSGTPMLTGVVDTSAAVLLAGAEPGMMFNVAGSTDVLAVVTTDPRPSELYLTRHLGVGDKWLSVCTIPSAGSALAWARQTLFTDLSDPAFFKLLTRLAKTPDPAGVTCTPAFAGSRTALDQPTAAFTGLRLSTTRTHLLSALIESLATASAARLPILRTATPNRPHREVLRTGGTSKGLAAVLYKHWPNKHTFTDLPEATVLGLGQLASGHAV